VRTTGAQARIGAAVITLVLLTGACGDDHGATAPTTTAVAPIQGFLDTATDDVADLPVAPTSSVPPTTLDADEGHDHGRAALNVLGDDPALDELAVACFNDDLGSCDDLYVESPDGSLYEAYGATCGARIDQPTNLLCADVLLPPTSADPAGLGGDPFLNALAEQCYAGDLLDCDILFAEAETNSAYERFGAGCAGRIPADTDRDCTELLP
jgi:hypothetical protein